MIRVDRIKAYGRKYINHFLRLNAIVGSIHPMWLIEEKASNFRVEFILRPPKAPKIAEIPEDKIKIVKKIFVKGIENRRKNGAIFCQDKMKKKVIS